MLLMWNHLTCLSWDSRLRVIGTNMNMQCSFAVVHVVGSGHRYRAWLCGRLRLCALAKRGLVLADWYVCLICKAMDLYWALSQHSLVAGTDYY